MIDSVIYFSQAVLKMKWCHVGGVLNTHNAPGRNSGKGVRVSGCTGQRGGEGGPIGLAVVGREQGERKRFVFKWGLEVGEIDCVCTPQRWGGGGRSVWDWDRAGERKTIYLHAIIAFTGIQNSIFLIWLKHRLQQVAENGRGGRSVKKIKWCTRLEAE